MTRTVRLLPAGPFREAIGKASPFLVPKYMRGVVTLGGFVPLCAMAYLAWQGQATLGFCTLGVYVMQLFAQIKTEGVYLRKGVTRYLVGRHFSHHLLPLLAHDLLSHRLLVMIVDVAHCCHCRCITAFAMSCQQVAGNA